MEETRSRWLDCDWESLCTHDSESSFFLYWGSVSGSLVEEVVGGLQIVSRIRRPSHSRIHSLRSSYSWAGLLSDSRRELSLCSRRRRVSITKPSDLGLEKTDDSNGRKGLDLSVRQTYYPVVKQ